MTIKQRLKAMLPDVGRNNELVREQWLEKKLSSISMNSRILDAGAGTQRYKKFCTHLRYVSQDFGEYKEKENDEGLQIENFNYGKLDIISDIISIPELNASFDAIMCVEVLEHLVDPSLAIKEFSRLLKAKGHLVLTAPFCSFTHMAPHYFNTGFSKYWYEKLLEDNGFEIIEIIPNGNYFEYIGQEIFRVSSIAKRYAKGSPNFWDMICMFFVQKMLARFSKKDNGSSELLCFGYQILARKH